MEQQTEVNSYKYKGWTIRLKQVGTPTVERWKATIEKGERKAESELSYMFGRAAAFAAEQMIDAEDDGK